MPDSAEPSRSISARLMRATLAFCLVFTLLTVLARTGFAWREQQAAMRAELALLEQVYQRPLAKAIWEMDRDLLKSHVLDAANVTAVGHVELQVRTTGGGAETLVQTRAGWTPSSQAPSSRLPLVYEPFPGGRETVGELRVEGDERVLWQRLRGEAVAIVLTQLIQSVLLAGFVMLMVRRQVTVHVQRIARHLAGLTPDSLGQPLTLSRHEPRGDELTQLVDGVNQLQGSLSAYLAQQREYERELAGHRDHLAGLVAERTAELQQLNAQLVTLSRSDALTGLPNRRHFDEMKQIEFRRAKRSGLPLSVLLCDIDFFKRYNDTYGHARGDECLRSVAQAMGIGIRRAGDLLARIGGEEFAVLLPATDEATARQLAETLRRNVAALAMPHAGSEVAPCVTLSVGIATRAAGRLDSFDALFHLADSALYVAKRRGRNRVACIDDPESLLELTP